MNIPSTLKPMPHLPFHEKLASWWGYDGDSPYVAFYWDPGADLCFDDGRLNASMGIWYNWLQYMHHPKVMLQTQALDFGSDEGPASHWLLLDQALGRVFVGTWKDVEAFLRLDVVDEPCAPVALTEEQLEEMTKSLMAEMERTAPPFPCAIKASMERRATLTMEIEGWIRGWKD